MLRAPETTTGLLEVLNIPLNSPEAKMVREYFERVAEDAQREKLQELANMGIPLPEEDADKVDMEDGNLVKHARRELEIAGLYSMDSDYDGMLGGAVLDLIKKFSNQGHSGFSAGQTIRLFHTLAQFKVLTPLTNDPGEWQEVDKGMWQSNRESQCFSEDGGKTYYKLDEKMGVYGCEKCDILFQSHTCEINPEDPEDHCGSCGKVYEIVRAPQPDLRHTAIDKEKKA